MLKKKKRKKKKMRKDEQALMYFMGMRANTQARQHKPDNTSQNFFMVLKVTY